MKMDPTTQTGRFMPFHHEEGKNGALLRFLDALGGHTLHPVASKTMFSINGSILKCLFMEGQTNVD